MGTLQQVWARFVDVAWKTVKIRDECVLFCDPLKEKDVIWYDGRYVIVTRGSDSPMLRDPMAQYSEGKPFNPLTDLWAHVLRSPVETVKYGIFYAGLKWLLRRGYFWADEGVYLGLLPLLKTFTLSNATRRERFKKRTGYRAFAPHLKKENAKLIAELQDPQNDYNRESAPLPLGMVIADLKESMEIGPRNIEDSVRAS